MSGPALAPTSGGILSEIITWVRRIIKTTSDQSISDQLIADYINRFYIYDMSERVQLFELKRQYTFVTVANVFEYQLPYANYQLLEDPVYCDGVQIGRFQSNQQFYNVFPELVLNEQPLLGNGSIGPFTIQLGQSPILAGFTDDLGNLLPYVYINAFDTSGNQMYIVDDGNGNLIQTDSTFQVGPFPSQTINPVLQAGSIDYITGLATDIEFNTNTLNGSPINTMSSPYSAGTPRICLFFNNIIKLYPVPSRPHKIQFDCYITPSQFLNTGDSVPFSYMAEYLSRGAARKILSDDGDYDQFQFYEPLFKEQENLVLRRTTRQNSTQRTSTIFNQVNGQNPYLYTQY
jgi:hypothetical protein